MSGGHFDYIQFRIKNDLAEELENVIKDYSVNCEYSEETLDKFKEGLEFIKLAALYTQRIDWLLSGDDGEESFHKRLADDLIKHNKEK